MLEWKDLPRVSYTLTQSGLFLGVGGPRQGRAFPVIHCSVLRCSGGLAGQSAANKPRSKLIVPGEGGPGAPPSATPTPSQPTAPPTPEPPGPYCLYSGSPTPLSGYLTPTLIPPTHPKTGAQIPPFVWSQEVARFRTWLSGGCLSRHRRWGDASQVSR